MVFPQEVIPPYRATPNNAVKQKRLFQELLDWRGLPVGRQKDRQIRPLF